MGVSLRPSFLANKSSLVLTVVQNGRYTFGFALPVLFRQKASFSINTLSLEHLNLQIHSFSSSVRLVSPACIFLLFLFAVTGLRFHTGPS